MLCWWTYCGKKTSITVLGRTDSAPTPESDVQLHIEDFKLNGFGERAIVKRLKLAFFFAVLPPKRIPFFAILR